MNTDDLILFETARLEIYKGLSTCFGLPDSHLTATLTRLAECLNFLDSEAAPLISQMAEEIRTLRDFTELQVEFTRLFVGPYSQQAPPCGSAYMEESGTMMGESTLNVVSRYREAGLTVADTFKEAPDHIVAELEFLSFLISKEIETLREESEEAPQTFLSMQKNFLILHIGAWIAPFSERLNRHATSQFYQNLANATQIIVKEEIDYLNTPGLSEQAAPTMR